MFSAAAAAEANCSDVGNLVAALDRRRGHHDDRRAHRLVALALQHIGRGVRLLAAQAVGHQFAEAFALLLRHHDEAPGTQPSMVRRPQRALEHFFQCFLVGAGRRELHRGFPADQQFQRIHLGPSQRISV